MKTMKTWQDFNAGTGAATTTWNYHANRGWLSGKRYQDNKGPDYTYTAGGRLKTRTWERGVSTTYKYGFDDGTGGNEYGDLKVIDYSDSTPDITFGYDRAGRRTSAARNGQTTTFYYNTAGLMTWEVRSDLWNVEWGYDTYLRRNQLILNDNSSLEVEHNYSYDTAGRLQKVYDGNYSA